MLIASKCSINDRLEYEDVVHVPLSKALDPPSSSVISSEAVDIDTGGAFHFS